MLALFDVEAWLKGGGLLLLAAIVFAESGLLVGFFLPGDSLLFIAGFLSADGGGHRLPALPITAAVAAVAAIAGDQVGYMFGRRVGPSLFRRPESRFFHPDHVERAQRFLAEHGPKTIVLARFVPIVRTFAPIIAGVGRMHYRTFVMFNVIGGVVWAVGLTTLGHYLGNVAIVKDNVEVAAVLIVAISLVPVALEILRHRREAKAARGTAH